MISLLYFSLQVNANSATVTVTVNYHHHVEQTLKITATASGADNALVTIASGTAEMDIRRPTLNSVVFTDTSNVVVSYAGSTQRTIRLSLSNNPHELTLVLTFSGALAADMSVTDLTLPAAVLGAADVTITVPAGAATHDVVVTFLASGTGRTLVVNAGAANTEV